MSVELRIDHERGCGWRKEGGVYLVGGAQMRECCQLPVPLTVCPTCSCGIKPARGFTWVDGRALVSAPGDCTNCLVSALPERCGLIWIGEKFYSTPSAFLAEASAYGISRRISKVPRDFKLGETVVLLAHRKGIYNEQTGEWAPAIVSIFKPSAIEYVTRGDETEEFLNGLEKRGITPVKVERAGLLSSAA